MALDNRQIEAFLAISADLHFSRAAARLGIAQSVLSIRLQRLEDVLGGRLIVRGRKAAVTLTPAGLAFLPEARATLARLDRAERIGRLAVSGRAGPCRIGYVFSAALNGVLARGLTGLRQRLPHLAIDAAPMESADQIGALGEARLDMGFFRPRHAYPEDVRVEIVHREELLLAIASDHALAARSRIVAADLAGEGFIVPRVAENMDLARAVTALAARGGPSAPAMIDTHDFVTAAHLAVSGHGVVLAPRSLANLNVPGLVYREIADFSASVELAFGWRGARTPMVDGMLEALSPATPG